MEDKRRVVVTGMGVVSCFGNNVDIFYDKLLAGDSGIVVIETIPTEDLPVRIAGEIRGFDPTGYVEKKQARRIDPYLGYTIVAGKNAIADAFESVEGLKKERCGVIIGSGMGGMHVYEDSVKIMLTKGGRRMTPFFVPYIITNMGSAMVAMEYGFMGPNYSISTACATANYSILAAARHIRHGDADVMVCGGVEAPIIDCSIYGFAACRALSKRNDEPTKASRPWDVDRDGFVIGEGAGVLVLESLEHAKARGARIYAEFLGGAMSCDAHHMTLSREDGKGVIMCMEDAFKDSGITHKDVDYINAHATSTLSGDLAEMNAIKKVFTNRDNLKVNSTKSMIGHCLGAAGGVEAIATVKAVTTGKIHPTINVDNPEPELDFDIIPNVYQNHDVNVAISNSFGFGGHNATLVFGKY